MDQTKIGRFAALESKRRSGWKLTVVIAALCVAVVFILLFFGSVSTPAYREIILYPEAGEENGWSYHDAEGNVGNEVYTEYGYLSVVDGITGNAVAAERVMDGQIADAVLKFEYMDTLVSVYLDGKLLYSDLYDTPQEGITFLQPDEADCERIEGSLQTHYITLPEDYAGKTLTVVSYFAEGAPTIPIYPAIQNNDTIAAEPLANSVRPLMLGGMCAAVAILLLASSVYAAASGMPEWPLILLAVFFIGVMVSQIYGSQAAYYSIGTNLPGYIFSALYIDLLLLFFGCYMRRGFRATLIAAVSVHAVLISIQAAQNAAAGDFYAAGNNGWITFYTLMLFVVLCLLEWKKKKAFFPAIGKCMIGFAVGYAVLLAASRLGAPESMVTEEIWLPVSSFVFGRAVGFNEMFAGYLALAGLVVVLGDFISRNISVKTERNTLALKSELMEENLRDMKVSMRKTDEQRHELKHHIAALQILLRNGEEHKAQEYLAEMADAVDESGIRQYTENMLVNAILNDEARKAGQEDISLKTELMIPEELTIPDKDLCSLLYNMLDNAIRGCKETPKKDREIYLKMKQDGNFLVILCCNPMGSKLQKDGGNIITSKKNRAGHGYGLSIMNRICDKYRSILLVETDGGFFTIKTNLRLPD